MYIRKSFLYIFVVTATGAIGALWILFCINKNIPVSTEGNFSPRSLDLPVVYKEYKNSTNHYTISIPENSVITEDSKNNETSFSFPTISPIARISLLVKENHTDLGVKDWWDSYGFEDERTSPTPYKTALCDQNGVQCLKIYFRANESNFGMKYYDTEIVLIQYKTKIYELWGYQLPENPSADLTMQDITAAHLYEQVFNHIVESIGFDKPAPEQGIHLE